jgi:hypothetical protein
LERLSKTPHKFIEKIKICNLPANIGCSGAWNLIIKTHMMEPYWIIVNHDVSFSPGLLEELVDKSQNQNVGILKGKEFQWDLFLIKDFVIQQCGLFDENFYPAYAEDNDYQIRALNLNIEFDHLNCSYLHGDINYETSGSQTWRFDLSLKEKLNKSYNMNLNYMTEKWGYDWRECTFNPFKNPFDNSNIPISYTCYNLEFVRNKNLGF